MRNRDIEFIVSLRDQFTATWGKVTSSVSGGVKGVINQLTSVRGAIQAAFAAGAFKVALDAIKEQEQANAKLASALRNVGVVGGQTQSELERFSTAMQSVTTYGDETVTAVQAMLISMTGTNDRVVELTKATLDLATGLNMDAESAAGLVAKTVAGGNALGRYGISVKDAGTQSERTSMVIDKLREKFGGMAEDQAKTATGSIEQMKNMMGELWETIGLVVAQILKELKPAIDWLVPILQTGVVVAINTVKLAFAEVLWVLTKFGQGIEWLGNQLGLWDSKYMEQLNRAAQKLVDEYGTNVTNAFKSAASAAGEYAVEVGKASAAQDQRNQLELLKDELDGYVKAQQKLEPGSAIWLQLGKLIADVREQQARLNAEFERSRETGTESFLKGMEESLRTFKRMQESVMAAGHFNIIDPKVTEEHVNIVRDQLSVLSSIRRDSYTSERQWELDELDASYKQQQELAHGNETLLTELRESYAKRRAAIELKYTQKAFQTFADLSMEAIGLVRMAEESRTTRELNNIQQRRDAELARIDEQLENENLTEAQREQLRDKRKQFETEFDNQRRAAQARQFAAMKKASIIESIIQTALAVTKALPNIPLAIAVGALGAAKTALISSQPTPQFHQGGTAFINASPSTEVPILVRGQETVRVTTPEQERGAGAGSIVINFNTPVPHSRWVVESVKKALRDTGLSADRLLVNNRRKTLVTA